MMKVYTANNKTFFLTCRNNKVMTRSRIFRCFSNKGLKDRPAGTQEDR